MSITSTAAFWRLVIYFTMTRQWHGSIGQHSRQQVREGRNGDSGSKRAQRRQQHGGNSGTAAAAAGIVARAAATARSIINAMVKREM